MEKVKLGKSVSEEMTLWRYMSIEKLIDLLENKTLFFAPLSYYIKSDPFEGYMPKPAVEAFSSLFLGEFGNIRNVLEDALKLKGTDQNVISKKISSLDEYLAGQKEDIKTSYINIAKSLTVNCWHANDVESEAMWKLYSENGNGIAIKTSIASLKSSIESMDQEHEVRVGAVKYLDYSDKKLTPSDCIVDGSTAPLIKRSSFSHENEVRLYIFSKLNNPYDRELNPSPKLVNVDISQMIEAIYISPYANSLFEASINTLCARYNIPQEKIIQSDLLTGHNELLNILTE